MHDYHTPENVPAVLSTLVLLSAACFPALVSSWLLHAPKLAANAAFLVYAAVV